MTEIDSTRETALQRPKICYAVGFEKPVLPRCEILCTLFLVLWVLISLEALLAGTFLESNYFSMQVFSFSRQGSLVGED